MDHHLWKKAFVYAYQKSFGNVSLACKGVGIARNTYYRALEADPEFKQELAELDPKEDYKDFIEEALRKKIKAGDSACIIFASKTVVKDRGYVERTEHTFRTDEPIEVTMKIT